MLRLVKPGRKYEKAFRTALKEFGTTEKERWFNTDKLALGFPAYISFYRDQERGVRMPKGYVPATMYFLMDGSTFIGRVQIRHRLNAFLRSEGGHIGYVIRPSKRKKGYGKEILRLALLKTKRLEMKKVLVTCDEGNEGSRKIIEANGGVFQNKVTRKMPSNQGGTVALRYWIKP